MNNFLDIDSVFNTTVVSGIYYAQDNDFYIGVDSTKPTTIYLPEEVVDGKIIVIKSEMKPPLGNRKITIKGSSGDTIDGYNEYLIEVSHEFLSVIYRGNSWHIIS